MNKKVGVEAEFFLLNSKEEAIVVPSHWDRDSFAVLGEIRGEPGDTAAETIGNFYKRSHEVNMEVDLDHTMAMEAMRVIKLNVYREAMKAMNASDKYNTLANIHNAYGTDIGEYSDQIVKNGKIQGSKASCGLHIHFSCVQKDERTIKKAKYSTIAIPIAVAGADTSLNLYKHNGYEEEETIEVAVSLLTKPAIEWIVQEMDKAFFKRFIPAKEDLTKYRQQGFYELKPYGFEYRSLPATPKTMEALPEIVEMAFHLLEELSKTSW